MKTNRVIETTVVAIPAMAGVAACNVPTTGKSDKTQHDDRPLRERVRVSFTREPLQRPDIVSVSSSDGIALLSGNVGSPDKRQRATALANKVPCAQGVENGLVAK
jgi:osmotically-inducible protein OsmY